ncbi:uncharacterized protein LOC126899534 [Daktulosphaira vitifoliae]|uniref:uncharacterized protein LOC126899534 n=1 Tax=Daktulosphaira vitifoliae TaxID=58002 RepID=UPI0021AAB191|nr:uncharacterized protein LOC126899534 [Daktulosphaira vitifoliae]
MGKLLSNVLSTVPIKSECVLINKDSDVVISKTFYRTENAIILQSRVVRDSRILLTARNVLKLQELKFVIHESVVKKLSYGQKVIKSQVETIISYFSQHNIEELSENSIKKFIHDHEKFRSCININANEPDFTQQIMIHADDYIAKEVYKNQIKKNKVAQRVLRKLTKNTQKT